MTINYSLSNHVYSELFSLKVHSLETHNSQKRWFSCIDSCLEPPLARRYSFMLRISASAALPFSNESRSCRRGSSRRVKMWRSGGEAMESASLIAAPLVHNNGGRAKACGNISIAGDRSRERFPCGPEAELWPSKMSALSCAEWVYQKRRGYKCLLACMTASFSDHRFQWPAKPLRLFFFYTSSLGNGFLSYSSVARPAWGGGEEQTWWGGATAFWQLAKKTSIHLLLTLPTQAKLPSGEGCGHIR